MMDGFKLISTNFVLPSYLKDTILRKEQGLPLPNLEATVSLRGSYVEITIKNSKHTIPSILTTLESEEVAGYF